MLQFVMDQGRCAIPVNRRRIPVEVVISEGTQWHRGEQLAIVNIASLRSIVRSLFLWTD